LGECFETEQIPKVLCIHVHSSWLKEFRDASITALNLGASVKQHCFIVFVFIYPLFLNFTTILLLEALLEAPLIKQGEYDENLHQPKEAPDAG
jgi:hypothetical protein